MDAAQWSQTMFSSAKGGYTHNVNIFGTEIEQMCKEGGTDSVNMF